jgi:hypothetical protein
MFFAVWKHAPIKTTLLRDLDEVCDVAYREFEDPAELRGDLQHFFLRIANAGIAAPIWAASGENRTEAIGENPHLARRRDWGSWGQQVQPRPARVRAQW